MVLSVYVIRLVTDELADGRIVGEVEDVESGGSQIIRNAEELVRFLARRRGEEEGK